MLRVKNGTFTFIDQNDKKGTPFVVNDFSFVSDNLNFSKKLISFRIDSLSISSKEKLLNIDYFKSNFNYESNKIAFDNFEFKNQLVEIKGKFDINNNKISYKEFVNSSFINIDINESKINPNLF